MSIKFIILGCGSSLGVPRIDGFFGNCDPKNKKNYRTRCCALIKSKNKNVLIDTSPDLKHQLIKNKINNIGYSGHLAGIDDALFAISNGAKYIEKHFTINNNLPGRDNKFAILPNDLRKICQFRDSVSLMTTNKGLNIQKCEIDIYKKYRGRWSGKR